MSERVFRSGIGRNPGEEYLRSHTYEMLPDGELAPMCGYGWNRSDGHAFSIFRGSPGTRGNCKLCARNVAADKPAVIEPWPHPTRWI